jgi:hypothetical protein
VIVIFLKNIIFLNKNMKRIRKILTEREMLGQIRMGKLSFPPLLFRLLQEQPDLGGVNVRFDALVEASWGGKKAIFCVEIKSLSTPKAFQDGLNKIKTASFPRGFQVYDLAESFRRRSSVPADGERDEETASGEQSRPFPFREGPVPECYTAENAAELRKLLVEKIRLFIEELGYDPENLCILVPRNREIEVLRKCLAKAGLEVEDITEEEFSFTSAGRIRVSTLHSSKGLDFPVVLLYLPYLYRRRQYDQEHTEKLIRNLLYVGITRAMDNVNVFVMESDDPILRDLAACFED